MTNDLIPCVCSLSYVRAMLHYLQAGRKLLLLLAGTHLLVHPLTDGKAHGFSSQITAHENDLF